MCPVCGGVRIAETPVAGLALRRCEGCGLRIAAFPEARETGYSAIDAAAYANSIEVVRRAQSASIVAVARAHVEGGEWLDVGCGFGHVIDAARAAGFLARGIEPNPLAAAAARRREIDVEDGTLAESTPAADVISTLDVLEHLDDINAFAERVRRKARRLWIIKVPSADGLFFRLAHAFRISSAVERLWQSRYEHPHRIYFDERTLGRFLENHGFDVIAKRYLPEIPTRTVIDRLSLDGRTPRPLAVMAVPIVFSINLIERLRARSDALLVLAKPRRASRPPSTPESNVANGGLGPASRK